MTANKYLYSVSLASLSYSLLVWYSKYLHNIQVCIAEKPKYFARKVELLELMHLYLDQTLNLNQEHKKQNKICFLCLEQDQVVCRARVMKWKNTVKREGVMCSGALAHRRLCYSLSKRKCGKYRIGRELYFCYQSGAKSRKEIKARFCKDRHANERIWNTP